MTEIANNVDYSKLGVGVPNQMGKSGELGKQDFLKLMITQLQHQDPLNPEDQQDFIAQMAQFGTVEGINNLQEGFSGLSSALKSNQILQASALVGRSVMVPSNDAELEVGKAIKGVVELEKSTGDLRINIVNAEGETVGQLAMGSQAKGSVNYAWDGTLSDGTKAPAGKYHLVAQAMNGRVSEPAKLYTSANINSVSIDKGNGNDIYLNVAGIGKMSIDSVKTIT